MSPSTDNFIHSLVEMSKAFEELPLAKAELERERSDNIAKAEAIQRLELKLIERAAEIDALHSKVREAEAGRDAAETLFLECDDKRVALARVVEGFTSNISALLKAQEPPPPPAPEPTPEPMVPEPASSNPAPVSAPVDDPLHNYDPGPSGVVFSGDPANVDSVSVAPGQSEADPTTSAPVDTIQPNVPPTAVDASTTDKPYHGKLYVNIPGWVSLSDWLAGGGTDETYNWREGVPLPIVEGGYFWRRAHDNTIRFEEDIKF